MAGLGCAELTPPTFRVPTRMFRDEETDDWRPYHTFKRRGRRATAMAMAPLPTGNGNGKARDEWEWVEDPDSIEGAVYPIEGSFLLFFFCFALLCP